MGSVVVAALVSFSAPAAAIPLSDTAETFRVSQSDEGESFDPYLAPGGQRVFFASTATDLVTGDTNGVADVFVSTAVQGDDPFAAAAELVSAPDGPVGPVRANGPSSEPVASADGRFVAVTSEATNRVAAGGMPGRKAVYVRDTLLNTTLRVQGAAEPDGDSYEPDMSDDGRYIVFTSTANNLSDDPANSAADSFIADLDANGDGTRGDIDLHRPVSPHSPDYGSHSPVVSGNGDTVAFLSDGPFGSEAVAMTGDGVFLTSPMGDGAEFVYDQASDLSVDATGGTFAFISQSVCDGMPTVVAFQRSQGDGIYSVAVGTALADRRSGSVSDPVISADGSTVAWTTTVPGSGSSGGAIPGALPEPIVRMQEVGWGDATGNAVVECSGAGSSPWIDAGEGSQATLSASGRTVAFSTTGDARIDAIDRHTNDGISVTSVQPTLAGTAFMTEVPTSEIPTSSLTAFAPQLAGAPIYRLPIERLPIHRLPMYRLPIQRLLTDDSPSYRLPIYRLPIHRLPIDRLDLPGGWHQVLTGSPFEDELIQSVTLDAVLTWADRALAPGSGATDAELASAQGIQSLTLQDLQLDSSGLSGLSLASYVLGDAPVSQLPTGAGISHWQNLVDAQGLVFTVDERTVVAELDSAGLDIARTGLDDVPLGDLPVDRTLFGEIDMTSLFLAGTPLGGVDLATLSDEALLTLFGTPDATGTLAEPSTPLVSGTVADLAMGATDDETFGMLLLSLLDAQDYPWEQIPAEAIDPRIATASAPGENTCGGNVRCLHSTPYRFAFDAGPGEPTEFAAPTASVTLPQGTALNELFLAGSGPSTRLDDTSEYAGPLQREGRRVSIPLPHTESGTTYDAAPSYSNVSSRVGDLSSSAELVSGDLRASLHVESDTPLQNYDDPRHTLTDGEFLEQPQVLEEGRLYYEWISPTWVEVDEATGQRVEGPAADEDYYLVDPPPPGKRLVISTNATDGQLSLSLYAGAGGPNGLGVENAGAVPGTPVTEQSDSRSTAEAGADAGTSVDGWTLVDQAVARGEGTLEVEAASAENGGDQPLLVRVASGNGHASSSMYSLRARHTSEPPEARCAPWAPPASADRTDRGIMGFTDPITDDTNTIYIYDEKRYGNTYGGEAADNLRSALHARLDGEGAEGAKIAGSVISVDVDPVVAAARTALDANPCSITARRTLVAAINAYVSAEIGEHRDQITSIVIVGGDDIIPFAPVAQNTGHFTEGSHAAELRLETAPGGGECPTGPAPDKVDPCETPLSAAAAADTILTDDPYGRAKAYESLGGYLYVPSVGLGRLVETPDQILAALDRFAGSGGVLDPSGQLVADSTVTAGYGAWSELPQHVTESLAWRSAQNQKLEGTWTADDMESAIFGDGVSSPRVVSINTHADETRMLPGVPGAAESGSFSDNALFRAEGHEGAASLDGTLVFLLGSHAGNNLPTTYYGDRTDWVDVFSQAGGFIGNTGYGLADDTTTALGERLLAEYAKWIGVDTGTGRVTAAQALTYAKQSYLAGLGLYSGYDEKVLLESVYYGLPMYTFTDPATPAPLPELPAGLTAVEVSDDGLSSASLTLRPTFTTTKVPGPDDMPVEVVTADGQDPAVIAGQPVLPKVVSRLDAPPTGLVARGALITSLSSKLAPISPAFGTPTVGVEASDAQRDQVAFPSAFATITHQDTPDGPADLLVVTPARVEAPTTPSRPRSVSIATLPAASTSWRIHR